MNLTERKRKEHGEKCSCSVATEIRKLKFTIEKAKKAQTVSKNIAD
jgi:hypothetical protein